MSALPKLEPYRHRWASTWIERVGQALDLTQTQLETVQDRYEAIGKWLGSSEHPWLAGSSIFVQGSHGLGTVTKPLSGEESDVDLIQKLLGAGRDTDAAALYDVIGARLRENKIYREMLEAKPRCWRISYANEFHLDITPAKPHTSWRAPALLIPDQRLKCLVPTNPIGFRELFERRAQLRPRILTRDELIKADIEPFPIQRGPKGVLRRIVQLLKRNRDIAFQDPKLAELKPISMIITALAARSYEAVVLGSIYDTDYDVLLAVVERMPNFIGVFESGASVRYEIMNETVDGENFADKWNRDPRLPTAFFRWHKDVLEAIRAIGQLDGQDEIARHTSRAFGVGVGELVLKQFTHDISAVRSASLLTVHPVLGVSAVRSTSAPVRQNTFFGAM